MPYISASIFMQLISAGARFQKMQRKATADVKDQPIYPLSYRGSYHFAGIAYVTLFRGMTAQTVV